MSYKKMFPEVFVPAGPCGEMVECIACLHSPIEWYKEEDKAFDCPLNTKENPTYPYWSCENWVSREETELNDEIRETLERLVDLDFGLSDREVKREYLYALKRVLDIAQDRIREENERHRSWQ
jgi:hypothetical protein